MKLTDLGFQRQKALEDFEKYRPQLPPEGTTKKDTKELNPKPIKDEVDLGGKEASPLHLDQPTMKSQVYRKATMGERLEALNAPNAPLGGHYVLVEPDSEDLKVSSSRAVPGDHSPTEHSKPEVESVRLIKNSGPTINGEEWLLSRPQMG